jgi:hypothetical protein
MLCAFRIDAPFGNRVSNTLTTSRALRTGTCGV